MATEGKRKSRWRHVVPAAAGTLLLAGIAAWMAASATPGWYKASVRERAGEGAALEAAAREVEEQFPSLQTWSDAVYVHELARSRGRVLEVPPPAKQFTLTLDEKQLNALIAKWLRFGAATEEMPVSEVVMAPQENGLRAAVKAPKWSGERVLWCELTEAKDGLEVGTARMGLLPVPRSFLPGSESLMAKEQARAAAKMRVDGGGKGNEAAQHAGAMRVAGQLLAGRLTEERCFLSSAIATPIAVRVQRRFEPGRITLTLTPLSGRERDEYVRELQAH